MDMDADGLVDVVAATKRPDGSVSQGVWRNTGSGWVLEAVLTLPGMQFDYSSGDEIQRGQFADINVDGRADWLVSYKDANGVDTQEAWINTPTGWQQQASFHLPTVLFDYASVATGAKKAALYDVNGDGLLDVMQALTIDGQTQRHTWLNTGKGFVLSAAYQPPSILMQFQGDTPQSLGSLMDVTGDGLLDFVHAYETVSGTVVNQVWRNTGAGWTADHQYALPGPLLHNFANRGHFLVPVKFLYSFTSPFLRLVRFPLTCGSFSYQNRHETQEGHHVKTQRTPAPTP